MLSVRTTFNWFCTHTWRKSAKNTAVCLLGCAIGDNLTILFFQLLDSHMPMGLVMMLAMITGLTTSIALETVILSKQMDIKTAIKVAFGMSFISMLMMESSANVTAILLAGGNRLMLTWWSILPSWIIGYIFAWVYNYYKLKKHGKSCHG